VKITPKKFPSIGEVAPEAVDDPEGITQAHVADALADVFGPWDDEVEAELRARRSRLHEQLIYGRTWSDEPGPD
jgi:hypothetical protein